MTLKNANKNDYSIIKQLYKKAFPSDERAPYFLLKRRSLQNKAQMLVAKDNDTFIGFVYLVCYKDLVYLFYFAVDSKQRRKGRGGEILRILKSKYSNKRIFLAREQLDKNADNFKERVNRRNFYINNGFSDLSCKIKEASVIYDVMGVNGNITAEEYNILITNWSGKFFRHFVDMRVVEY